MILTRALPAALACAVFLAVSLVSADDKKDDGPKAEPKSTPLEVKITGKTTTYTLTKEAAAEYAKAEETVKKGGTNLPEAPKLDLAIELRNTSDKAVRVWTGGDPRILVVKVRGKGAVNLEPRLAYTDEFMMPIATEIAAGKSISVPLKSLRSGYRGISPFACWTAAGDYELVVELKTGVSPKPEGSGETVDGAFGSVLLTSAPFAVTVEMEK